MYGNSVDPSDKTVQTNQPQDHTLISVYPNPFNSSVNIVLDIPYESDVSLVVFDLLGREVTRISCGTLMPGSKVLDWNASGIPSGVYFVQVSNGTNRSEIKKIVLMR